MDVHDLERFAQTFGLDERKIPRIERALKQHGVKLYLAAGASMHHAYLTENNLPDTDEYGQEYTGDEMLAFVFACNNRELRQLCKLAEMFGEPELEAIH